MHAKIHKYSRTAESVALDIFDEIPESEIGFRNDIRRFAKEFSENKLKHRGWAQIETIIYKYIRDVNDEWKRKIIEIYNGN
jgi:hypothetical protein